MNIFFPLFHSELFYKRPQIYNQQSLGTEIALHAAVSKTRKTYDLI